VTPTAVIVDEIAADLPPLLKTNEVATLLRITRRHVYRLVASRELRPLSDKRGAPLRIPKRDVLNYIESRLGG
jgi:excisionase family DNA binding protein